jgi:hypothetical protein
MSTPGMPLVWCFGLGSEIDLSVMTDGGSILVHVMEPDHEVSLGSVAELITWLQAHKPESLKDQKGGVIDKLKTGRFFRWE